MSVGYNGLVLILIGLSMGIGLSFWIRYYIKAIHRVKRLTQFILAFSVFGVSFAAIMISSYLFSTPLFKGFNTESGRMMFMLLWIIPFCITAIVGAVRLARHNKLKRMD